MQWIAKVAAQKFLFLHTVAAIILKTHSFRPHSHAIAIITCTEAQMDFYIDSKA